MFWVYLGFGATILLGSIFLKNRNPQKLLGTSLLATLAFWLISNFGIWIQAGGYPETAAGGILCYTAALPFLFKSLIGDLFFVFLLFGTYDYVNSAYLKPQKAY